MPVSAEDLASQLGFAAADVYVANELADRDFAPPPEVVSNLTDDIIGQPGAPGLKARSFDADETVAFIEEVKDGTALIWSNVRDWLKKTFSSAQDKLKEL